MRVLHLSTFDQRGGAGRAAFRLHQGLRQAGCDSSMLVREKSSDCDSVFRAPEIASTRLRRWAAIAGEHIHRNRTPDSNTYFSLGQPGLDLASEPRVRAADILHLHWVADFLSPDSLAALAATGKPMVWTLHDVRPFSGGCHFPAGCTGFETDCGECAQLRQDRWHVPRRVLRDQMSVLAQSGLAIVTPSAWLGGLARRSRLFREQRIETIPYGVPLAEFSPMPQGEARRRFGLAEDGCYFLFGADYAAEKRKGLRELRAAVESLPREIAGRFRLLAFGTSSPELEALGSVVQPLGYLQTSEDLRAAYAAADYFVLTSLEDNLPCVMLEAMACATPVVAFASGGIPEVVRSGETGWTVSTGDVRALGALFQRLIENRAERSQLSARAAALMREEFGTERETERYLALYRSLSPRPPSRRRRATHLRRALPMLSLAILRRFGLRTGLRLLRGKPAAPSEPK